VINDAPQPRVKTPILVGFTRKSSFDGIYLIDKLRATGVNLLCKVKEKLNNGYKTMFILRNTRTHATHLPRDQKRDPGSP